MTPANARAFRRSLSPAARDAFDTHVATHGVQNDARDVIDAAAIDRAKLEAAMDALLYTRYRSWLEIASAPLDTLLCLIYRVPIR